MNCKIIIENRNWQDMLITQLELERYYAKIDKITKYKESSYNSTKTVSNKIFIYAKK